MMTTRSILTVLSFAFLSLASFEGRALAAGDCGGGWVDGAGTSTNSIGCTADAHEAAKHPGQPAPSLGHQAVGGETICDRCKKLVPTARTNITATGTVCDLCAAGLPA